MRAIRTWGSVRGVLGNRHPYRDQRRDATRAPIQARNGWRSSDRLLINPPHHLRNAKTLSRLWGPPHNGLTRGGFSFRNNPTA
jgi:hypothetical protein